jgi:hypothetical protein
MDFDLNAHLIALLMMQDCADWLFANAASGAAPTFNDNNELVFRFKNEDEGLSGSIGCKGREPMLGQ